MMDQEKGQDNLRKLQSGDFRLFSEEEIKCSKLYSAYAEIPIYVAKMNSFKAIPSSPEIKKRFGLGLNTNAMRYLEEREILFDITIPDILKFYDIKPSSRASCLPAGFEWLRHYLQATSIHACRSRGGAHSWEEKKMNPRGSVYERHFIANLKDKDGLPCYAPLNLHIKTG
jgi:hypothetical protein